MEAELEQRLEAIETLACDNRRMLKKLLRYRRLEALYAVIKWLIFAGATLWAYYYLQPYLEQVLAAYSQVNGLFQGLSLPGNN
ncbi:MAG: hypothetical protein A2589_02705 [Candidatus Vogelbacteria bacterium RIFOXYD1_FULL_46_19]|uniref:Uncharacterized protein n=1 Tax=Candidatus Vogelbacteria bacterium RIFOXYD1_FULL_46_19 TaxID=1802439 RepID=A0A1G2QHS7_9BACT|nr:MAG: hypothetical protein A2589_02705 [Candidatus Vogelbacteria bacterium RIFOXYD1_FULL_46_19]